MNQTVLGLDPSLVSTGVAAVTRYDNGDITAATWCVQSKGKRDDGIPERWRRLAGITAAMREASVERSVLAVIEAPAHSTPGGSTWDRAALWWLLVSYLVENEVPIATVAPTTRLKWATGSGRAGQGKAGVVAAMVRMWPDVQAQNDDEWDALAMASMGAQRLGWEQPETLARHRESLGKAKWPAIPGLQVVPA